MKIQFESACASRRGHQCDRCEDASIVRSDLALFAVIDGSGISNRAGLSASLVAKSVENYFEATMCDPVEQVDRFQFLHFYKN